MRKTKFDLPHYRLIAGLFSFYSFLGWAWSLPYHEETVDKWELPTLSAMLLMAAFLPLNIVVSRKFKPIVIGFLALDIGIFVWWLAERAHMEYGGYDVGGIALRLIAYGVIFPLLLPQGRSTNEITKSAEKNEKDT